MATKPQPKSIRRAPAKKAGSKFSDVYKPDNTMIRLPANATPSQIANIKAYARSLETRRKGAAADKMGAEGPKRSSPVNKRSTPIKKTVAKRTTVENRGAMMGSGSKTTKINTPKAGIRFVERFPSGKSNIRPAWPYGRKAKGK